MPPSSDLSPYAPLAELAGALRAGRIGARDLLAQAEAAHSAREGDLGAYRTWAGEAAHAGAALADAAFVADLDLGPLQGLPVSVKDIFGVPGLPTFAGSPRRLPAEWERAGPLVERLRRQLATIPGKTHTVEFAFGGLGTNPHAGTPVNPWDARAHRVPGGSSAGAGVSLWQGTAVLALGTDTAGSVRIPAAMTGTVGLKTTHGRWSIAGIVPLSPSFDTPGLLARSVADVIFALGGLDPAMVAGIDVPPPAGLRLGIAEGLPFDDLSPGIGESVETALAELSRGGARLSRHTLAHAEESLALFREGGLAAPELRAFLASELPDWLDGLDPNVRARVDAADALPSWVYIARKARFAAMARATAAGLDGLDVLVTPTLAITPPTLEDLAPEGAYARLNMGALRNTAIANMLGLCAITLPVGLDAAGMPVGMQLMAGPGREGRLLAVAAAIEAVLGPPAARLGPPPRL